MSGKNLWSGYNSSVIAIIYGRVAFLTIEITSAKTIITKKDKKSTYFRYVWPIGTKNVKILHKV